MSGSVVSLLTFFLHKRTKWIVFFSMERGEREVEREALELFIFLEDNNTERNIKITGGNVWRLVGAKKRGERERGTTQTQRGEGREKKTVMATIEKGKVEKMDENEKEGLCLGRRSGLGLAV